MDVWHPARPRTFDQHDRSIGASCKRRRLQEESAVHQRRRKVGKCFSLDEDRIVHEIVASCEVNHVYIEAPTPPREIEHGGIAFGTFDTERLTP